MIVVDHSAIIYAGQFAIISQTLGQSKTPILLELDYPSYFAATL